MQSSVKIKQVAMFGGAEVKPESKEYQQVFAVAKTLAEHDYVVVNGGGPGVMEAATRGAESVNGETLVVTFDPKNAPGFEHGYAQNVADVEIKTHDYIERIGTLMKEANCYIIFTGGTGTISEFGLSWCLARLYYPHHRPFILYGDFWYEIIESFKKNMMMRGEDLKVFKIVNSPEAVLQAIHEFDQEMIGIKHDHCQFCGEAEFMR